MIKHRGVNRSERSMAREIENRAVSECARDTLKVLDRLEVLVALYGTVEGPPEWAKFVMRCYNCNALLDYCIDIPQAPGGLSPKKCKGCGKLQPMIQARRRFDPKLFLTVQQDYDKYVASKASQATRETETTKEPK